jgi:hypothetical protein
MIIQADGAAPTFRYGLPIGRGQTNRFHDHPNHALPQGGQAIINVITRPRWAAPDRSRLTPHTVVVLNSSVFDQSQADPQPLAGGIIPFSSRDRWGLRLLPTAGYTRPITGAQLAAAGQGSLSPACLCGDDATSAFTRPAAAASRLRRYFRCGII